MKFLSSLEIWESGRRKEKSKERRVSSFLPLIMWQRDWWFLLDIIVLGLSYQIVISSSWKNCPPFSCEGKVVMLSKGYDRTDRVVFLWGRRRPPDLSIFYQKFQFSLDISFRWTVLVSNFFLFGTRLPLAHTFHHFLEFVVSSHPLVYLFEKSFNFVREEWGMVLRLLFSLTSEENDSFRRMDGERSRIKEKV